MNFDNLTAHAEEQINKSTVFLKDFRQTQLALFKTKGIREITQDSYKYTKPATLLSELVLGDTASGPSQKPEAGFLTITLRDGVLDTSDMLPDGLTVRKLGESFREFSELFKEELNPFSHLHHALMCDGIIIEIEKHRELTHPVRILHLNSKPSISAPTVIILARSFSKVSLIEEGYSTEASHGVLGETYLFAEEGSSVEHIVLDEETMQGINHSSVIAEIARDARVRSIILHASGKLLRKNLILNLNAPGAAAESYCLFLTSGSEHSDINTVLNHRAPDTTSNQIAKGILDGESKGIFTGKIHIFPKAQRVNSGQLNKNLLLSKKAQVHSQPQLEIFADDVKSSHGSTTGQLSDDEIFYFQARGIPEDRARNILALGFGLEVVQKIENKEASDYVSRIIRENLATKFSLGGNL